MKEENRSIKQNWLGVSGYIILELFMVNLLLKRDWTQVSGMHILNLVVALIFLVLLLKSLLSPYIRIEGGVVHIFHDTFIKKNFSIDEVSLLEISVTPFSKSYFQLKDGSKIKFDTFGISRSDLDFLQRVVSNTEK